MQERRRLSGVLLWFVALLSSAGALAAPVTQNITLKPGWNAVYLEVKPPSTVPEDVFSGIAELESVWLWNPQTSTVEFVQDASIPIPEGSTWLNYYPAMPMLTTLNAIHGRTPYLIKLGGSSDVVWSVTGEPGVPYVDWKQNSFNFVGFHLEPGQEPLFEDFFSSSPAHADEELYVLNNATGNWEEVTSPLTTPMKRGEAFFIFSRGSSQFTGPLSIQLDQSTGLHYDKLLQEQGAIVRNSSASPKTVSLSLSGLNDTVYHFAFDPAQEVAGWTDFTSPLVLQVPSDEKQNLRLGVNRLGLIPDTDYEANMTVRDGQGTEINVPVSVTGISYAGLWVGDATITRVNEPANSVDPITPVETGSEFSFRLIVHADEATDEVILLSQVIQMWQEGTFKPDPNDLSKLIVDEPGSFVLLTDDSLISEYSGAAIRDGQLVGRRVSSPAFPSFSAAEGLMTGSMSPPAGELSILIDLAQDDPTNPFRHLFHPDHALPEQSYQVTRAVTMEFSDVDQEGRPITGIPGLSWGSTELGGIYKEQISGLHRDTLRIEGTFFLNKVSNVGTLTTP